MERHPRNYFLQDLSHFRANTFSGMERQPRNYFLQEVSLEGIACELACVRRPAEARGPCFGARRRRRFASAICTSAPG